LPTRVVHIGDPEQGTSPRLIETKGKTGHYVALSHCWGGPSHTRPLMTTRSTFKQFLAGIPWDNVPKAHQEAMTAARRLGFEYIWIDSLCIIQDSHNDWLYESKHMGSVYENARLTIAASHTPDSSQHCFFPRPQPQAPIELRHISRTGENDGSIFASPMPTDYAPISPEDGPLATRAWATQEWLLSRRMLFYTDGALVWSCKTISQRETGGTFHDTARNPRWKVIIEKYSARSLTNASDRLVALEGLRAEMQKIRLNDTYCFGLWKHNMPDQLLWYCLAGDKKQDRLLPVPSWTWA
ncbi:HET-domain-containing protein, partial [Pleomassaria siparia CBS 279.74]